MEKTAIEEGTTYPFVNPYIHTIDTSKPSKTRLKKCEKGLHEFKETHHDIAEGNMFVKKWACKHCGQNINRNI